MDTDFMTLALAVTAVLLAVIVAAALAGDGGSIPGLDADHGDESDHVDGRARHAHATFREGYPECRRSVTVRPLLH